MKPEGICRATGKVGYSNEAGAELVLGHLQKQGRNECRTYQCPRCSNWHLTSQPLFRIEPPAKPTILQRLRERLLWVGA